MPTALLTHPDSLAHVTPPGHPEQVARAEAIAEALSTPKFDPLLRVEAPLATDEMILRAHPEAYLARIRTASPGDRTISLDPDTHMSPGTLNAALRGAGAAAHGVDLVMSGTAGNAFSAHRPPGHHAERETAMGFCFFGNAVIAARHALAAHGLSRAAILDFDVHHGNGTQDLVWEDPAIFFASSHQSPLYPGSGRPNEQGAHGQIVNMPLPAGTEGPAFRTAWARLALPALLAHKPEILIFSAGFDGHAHDPLANFNLYEEDFAWITDQLCAFAAEHCAGRVVSLLEGGYDLGALARSVAAHVEVLMEYAA